ncbi:NACHT domain-containing protein, partial [Candidatus Poribacteria bacterium]|nr:NACHT domain-containing protein [Candidatus Poribacteria bacterium]
LVAAGVGGVALAAGLGGLAGILGATGALFKLASLVEKPDQPLPLDTAILAALASTYVSELDKAVKRAEDGGKNIAESVKRAIKNESLRDEAQERLKNGFTWLSVIRSDRVARSEEWALVKSLSELGSDWARQIELPEPDAFYHSLKNTLAASLDQVLAERAADVKLAQEQTQRDALELLREAQEKLDETRLFGEIEQEKLYVERRYRAQTFMSPDDDYSDWDKIEATSGVEAHLGTLLNGNGARIVVIEGDMGAGKTCLMRRLAADLARTKGSRTPLYVHWRPIHDAATSEALLNRIAGEVSETYSIDALDLPSRTQIILLVDGFDEMTSHDRRTVESCFNRLVALKSERRFSVVVSMRSSLLDSSLKALIRDGKATAIHLEPMTPDETDRWVENYANATGRAGLTGSDLRQRAGEQQEGGDITGNPLLLYLMMRYPMSDSGTPAAGGFDRQKAELFRFFVDQTVSSKAERSGERGVVLTEYQQDYRYLLQELAALATLPGLGGACSVRDIEHFSPGFRACLEQIKITDSDLRSPFVLYFFEPRSAATFQFHPEGFREYLFAEWCVRQRFDVFLGARSRPHHPIARKPDDAPRLLAKFPVSAQEGAFLNALYEELGALAKDTAPELAKRMQAFAHDDRRDWQTQIRELYEVVLDEANAVPKPNIPDMEIGKGPELELGGLEPLWRQRNAWMQLWMATFGLYRGMEKDPASDHVLTASWALRLYADVCRTTTTAAFRRRLDYGYDAGGIHLHGLGLRGAHLEGAHLELANLEFANLFGAHLVR